MKQRSLTIISILFSCCLAIFACRKEIEDIIHNRQVVPQELTESAKIWYLKNLIPEVSFVFPAPKWEESWIIQTTDGEMLVVPVEEPMSDQYTYREDVTFRRFLVTYFYGNTVKEGKIIEFWGDSYDVEKHSDFLLKNHDENAIPSFNGSIIQYSINYDPLKNVVYENGRVNKNKDIKIMVVPPGVEIENFSNKRVTESTCSPPFVTNSGFPDNMCDGGAGMVFYKVTTTFGFDGCPILIRCEYLSHVCYMAGGGSGDGSAGGGGIGSGGNLTEEQLWALEPQYKAQMTDAEIYIYDRLSYYDKLNYLNNAWWATIMANAFYSPASNQQKNDAYRHAYFAYRNTLYLGRDKAESLGNAHEDYPTNPALEKQMDLFNNSVGMQLADHPFATYTGEAMIKLALENGALKIIKNGALVPSNQ